MESYGLAGITFYSMYCLHLSFQIDCLKACTTKYNPARYHAADEAAVDVSCASCTLKRLSIKLKDSIILYSRLCNGDIIACEVF